MARQYVFFDMDGTLFDTETVYHIAWRAAAVELGLPHDRFERTLADCTGRNAKDTRDYFETYMADLVSYDDFIKTRGPYYDAEIERRGGIPKKPGLHELFDYLKANGYKMALATSTRRVKTLENLERTGLMACFDALITGDMVEQGKPHPETYLRAAEALGLAPEECMGVEDSLAGVRAISAAGMFTVMVPDMVEPTPEIEALLDAKCLSLHEIIPLLQAINPNGIY